MADAAARERDTLRTLASDSVASRLFDRDASLWPPPSPGGDPADQTLGWLGLPTKLRQLGESVSAFAAEIKAEGFTDAVVCGMGGSSMTAEVLRASFAPQPGWLNLHVVDTVHPDTVSNLADALDLSRTVFLIASKSGTTVEPLTLEAYFRAVLTLSGAATPRHFVALTDAGTPLAERAVAGEFRKWFETPRDVGGRFSALTAFGMLPAALMGLDLAAMAAGAEREREVCQTNYDYNAGLILGAALGGHALDGRDKVTLISTPKLQRFGLWIEQLLAESTGKNGRGLIPVAGEPFYGANEYGTDRHFVYLRLAGDDASRADSLVSDLESEGHAVTRQDWEQIEQISGLMFRWEFATAVAATVIDVYPFDQPDVEIAKQKARAILSGAGGTTISRAPDIDSALVKLLSESEQGAYVAVGAFLDESDELTEAFNELRSAITRRTGMATTFGYGPRYQHSIGQLYKGGPAKVRMLVVKSHGTVDIPVPGTSYTLSALLGAQADGDVEAMRDRGRRTEAVVIGDNPVVDVLAAVANLDQKH